jgi:cellulose synthase operon protein B
VLLNGRPINSVRMSDTTAAVPTNHDKVMIPSSAILPGINRLSVMVNLQPVLDCASRDFQGLWVNIWPESLIHLPLVAETFDPNVAQDLATLPAPFTYEPTLGTTAFVLERNNLESWQNAMKIAKFLGSAVNGSLTKFSVFYGDAVPADDRAKYNLLIVGRPSQIPIVTEINNDLPAPFLTGSDVASGNGNFQVTYRIPPDSPMGYVEILHSPWNPSNVVLAILGNTTQGVNWATTALVDSTLRWRLGGNFAVIDDKQIVSSDTQNVETGSETVLATAVPSAVPTSLNEAAAVESPETHPIWIMPVVMVSVGLILIIIVVTVIQNRGHIKVRKQHSEMQKKDSDDDTHE